MVDLTVQCRGLVRVQQQTLLVLVVLKGAPDEVNEATSHGRRVLAIYNEHSAPLLSPFFAHRVQLVQDSVTGLCQVVAWRALLRRFFRVTVGADAWLEMKQYVDTHTWFRRLFVPGAPCQLLGGPWGPATETSVPVYATMTLLQEALERHRLPVLPPPKKSRHAAPLTEFPAPRGVGYQAVFHRVNAMAAWFSLYDKHGVPPRVLASTWTDDDLLALSHVDTGHFPDPRALALRIMSLGEQARDDLATALPQLPTRLAVCLARQHAATLPRCAAPRIAIPWALPDSWQDRVAAAASGLTLVNGTWWWTRPVEHEEAAALAWLRQERASFVLDADLALDPDDASRRMAAALEEWPVACLVVWCGELGGGAPTDARVFGDAAMAGLDAHPANLFRDFGDEHLLLFTHVLVLHAHVLSAARLAHILRVVEAARVALLMEPGDPHSTTVVGTPAFVPMLTGAAGAVVPHVFRELMGAEWSPSQLQLPTWLPLMSRWMGDAHVDIGRCSSRRPLVWPEGRKAMATAAAARVVTCRELWTTLSLTLELAYEHLAWFTRDEWLSLAHALYTRRPALCLVLTGFPGVTTAREGKARLVRTFEADTRRATHYVTQT